MEKLILFINAFLSYFIVVLAVLAGAAIAFIAGRMLKKRNNAKKAKVAEEVTE